MDNKGQGALEYLLLIGGVILLVAVVIIILNELGLLGSTETHSAFNKVENAWENLKN
ncbi:MAG: class III signal peptide-containing protein [Candidatus Diapherotrites archaeon]